MLKLVVNNTWTQLPTETKNPVLHREFTIDLHGLVFTDENGVGNAVLVDRNDNCLALREVETVCYKTLKQACNEIYIEFHKEVAASVHQ